MSWRDHINDNNNEVTLPWTGGRVLHSKDRSFKINGTLPREHGWYTFSIKRNRVAYLIDSADSVPGALSGSVMGYLVGDRIVPDDVRCDPDPEKIFRYSERVFILEPGINTRSE